MESTLHAMEQYAKLGGAEPTVVRAFQRAQQAVHMHTRNSTYSLRLAARAMREWLRHPPIQRNSARQLMYAALHLLRRLSSEDARPLL